jgi:hypothetical protein
MNKEINYFFTKKLCMRNTGFAFYFVLFLVGLGFEFRALCFKPGALLLEHPIHFALIILNMGSLKLFAQTGLKL